MKVVGGYLTAIVIFSLATFVLGFTIFGDESGLELTAKSMFMGVFAGGFFAWNQRRLERER